MTVRRLPLAVGVVALLAGTAVAVGLAPPLPPVAESLLFVAVVLVGGLVAARAVLTRASEGPESDPLPAPNHTADARVPGEAIDRRPGRIASDADAREELRDRIEAVAVATVARTEGCSPADAREQLAAGTWTDDERAAAFFIEDPPSPTVAQRVRSLVRGESVAQRRAAHAIDELHDRRDEG